MRRKKTLYSGRKWFTVATGVNQSTGYGSAYIKTYTQLSKLLNNEKYQTFSDNALQLASDQIAKKVLSHIINHAGKLPSFEEIMILDFQTATPCACYRVRLEKWFGQGTTKQ